MSCHHLPVRWLLAGAFTLCLGGLLSLPVEAALTHYVPFDAGYTAGNPLNGQGGSDLGFGGNTWFDGGDAATVIAGNLPAPAGLPVAGNHASTDPANFNLAFYTMDQDNDGSNGEVGEDNLGPGVHWISLNARAALDADFGGLSLVKFFGPEILYIGKVGGNGSSTWGFDQGAAGGVAATGSDATVDSFLVVKLTIGPGANDDTADLYINPALGVTPPGAADIAGYALNEDPGDNRAIDELRLGSQNGAFLADEIRIGSTFADVAIPEPTAAVLLLGLSVIGLGARRR